MIELVLEDRCTACGICAEVCPTFVFDKTPEGKPIIARKDDCDTCYQCEVHCPSDALYVGPLRYPAPVDRDEVLAQGTLGNLRRAYGFDRHKPGSYAYSGDFTGRSLYPKATSSKDPNIKIYEALAELEQRSLVKPATP